MSIPWGGLDEEDRPRRRKGVKPSGRAQRIRCSCDGSDEGADHVTFWDCSCMVGGKKVKVPELRVDLPGGL